MTRPVRLSFAILVCAVASQGTAYGQTLTFQTTSLPPAQVGVEYQASLQATGGSPPYAFQIIEGFRGWMRLASDGTFSGTPDAEGEISLTISVFDSAMRNVSGSLRLRVEQPQPLALVEKLNTGVVSRNYRLPMVTGGVPPYSAALSQGQIPEGLSIQGAELTGMPTKPGNYQFTVDVRDSNEPQGRVAGRFEVKVIEIAPLAIEERELKFNVRAEVSAQLTGKGGVPPYSWAITRGALPTGFSFSDGLLTGTSEEAQTATVTFSLTDSENSRVDQEFFIQLTKFRISGSNTRRRDRNQSGCICVPPQETRKEALWLGVLTVIGFGRRLRFRRSRA